MENKYCFCYLPYGLIIVLRVFAPFLIWKNVFWALGAALFLDLIDFLFFRLAYNWPWDKSLSLEHPIARRYKTIDKLLDFYWYVFILLYIYVRMLDIFPVFLFLFLLRLAGMIIYFVTKYRNTFIFFPNLFEALFIVYVLTLAFPGWEYILKGDFIYLTILTLLPIKLVQEYICCSPRPLVFLRKKIFS